MSFSALMAIIAALFGSALVFSTDVDEDDTSNEDDAPMDEDGPVLGGEDPLDDGDLISM